MQIVPIRNELCDDRTGFSCVSIIWLYRLGIESGESLVGAIPRGRWQENLKECDFVAIDFWEVVESARTCSAFCFGSVAIDFILRLSVGLSSRPKNNKR